MAPAAVTWVKRTAKGGIRHGVKAVAAAGDLVRRPDDGVVVLIYHRVVDGAGGEVDQPAEVFLRQVGELAGRAITLDAAAGRLAAAGAGLDTAAHDDDPGPPVVLTFDDGTPDWVDHVLPVLVAHGVPATFYVATSFVEDQQPFPWGSAPVSWAGLAELVSTGLATIGSHTHTHLLLDRVGPEEAAQELDRSTKLIEDRLGVACHHFAYPKALPASGATEEAVRGRFVTAAVGGGTPNPWATSDLHRLTRTPIQRSDGMTWFRRKATGGLALEGTLRERISGRRYAANVT